MNKLDKALRIEFAKYIAITLFGGITTFIILATLYAKGTISATTIITIMFGQIFMVYGLINVSVSIAMELLSNEIEETITFNKELLQKVESMQSTIKLYSNKVKGEKDDN